MRTSNGLALIFSISCFALGCGSSDVTGKDTAPGVVCDGANCPQAAATIAGTWEIIGSRPGDVQKSAIAAISPGSLVVIDWKGITEAIRHGDTFDVQSVASSAFNSALPERTARAIRASSRCRCSATGTRTP